MRTGPITIDGIAGPILVDSNFWNGKQVVTVGGVQIKSSGRKWFSLPTADGAAVEARVTSSLISPFPTIDVAGVKHAMGPALPTVLKVLILLPVVLLVGGLLGGLIGALAVVANARISVWTTSTAVKAFAMIGVLIVAALLWMSAVTALVGAGNS